MTRSARMLAGVAAGTVCLVACTGAGHPGNAAVSRLGMEPVLAGGPLHMSDAPSVVCLPAVESGVYAMGVVVVRNRSTKAAKVTGVELADSRGVRVVQAFLAPVKARLLVGTAIGWPPPKSLTAGLNGGWQQRQPVPTAHLDGSTGRPAVWNLVLRLNADDPRETAQVGYSHASLRYSLDGQDYLASDRMGLRIRQRC